MHSELPASKQEGFLPALKLVAPNGEGLYMNLQIQLREIEAPLELPEFLHYISLKCVLIVV